MALLPPLKLLLPPLNLSDHHAKPPRTKWSLQLAVCKKPLLKPQTPPCRRAAAFGQNSSSSELQFGDHSSEPFSNQMLSCSCTWASCCSSFPLQLGSVKYSMFTKIAAISVELHTGNMQKIIPKLYCTAATESQALMISRQLVDLLQIFMLHRLITASKLLLLPLPKPKLCKNFFL